MGSHNQSLILKLPVIMRTLSIFTSVSFRYFRFAAPSKLSVILGFVRAIALDAFGALYSAQESDVFPFPAVLVLGDSWVHIHSPNDSDVLSYVEAPIDEHLGIGPALNIPYVDPYYGHVRFG